MDFLEFRNTFDEENPDILSVAELLSAIESRKSDEYCVQCELCQMIGNRVQELRRTHDINLGDLAKKIKLPASHIGISEMGAGMLCYNRIVILCNIFNVSVEYLLLGEDNKKNPTYGELGYYVSFCNTMNHLERDFFIKLSRVIFNSALSEREYGMVLKIVELVVGCITEQRNI